ncbi:MAG: DUF1361 domain-containing protein [Chitinophagaceae bacterium]
MRPDILINRKAEFKISMKQWLLVCCGFSCLLVCIRIVATGYLTYLFLVWNLFLALIPFAISEWLFKNNQVIGNKWKLSLSLLCWLLFIPNSFYIVTDLFHLDQFDSAPKWFDLLLLFSFAWNGLVLGIISVRKIELLLHTISRRRFSIAFVCGVMWLNAFGVYVGRYLRYNSWDIITQPFSLFQEMLNVIIHPLHNKMEWGMITSWAVFMTLFYITIKKLAESFLLHKR